MISMLRWRADSDKLGQEWIAPVSPEVREALEALRAEQPGVGEAWIFPAPRSEGHVRVDVTRHWLRRAEELAELDHPRGFGRHSLRRMWATKRKHLSVQDVAAVGGWKQTQTLQEPVSAGGPGDDGEGGDGGAGAANPGGHVATRYVRTAKGGMV